MTIERDLGSTAKRTGTFTITDAAISASSVVEVRQAALAYTGKGTRTDEAEMQPIVCTARPGSGSAVVRWVCDGPSVPVWPASKGNGARSGNSTLNPINDQRSGWTIQQRGKVRGNVKFSYTVR